MPTRFYITPYDPIHWKDENSPGVESTLVVRFLDFSQAAKSVWSTYKTYPFCSWAISFPDDFELSGSFSGKNNQILTLGRAGYHFNQFVAWYRSYISPEYRLFLFVEGDWDALELTAGITDQDVSNYTGIRRQ